MTVPSGANAGTYFYSYDGNGNVVALVNAATGAIAANYEYGPFGELIRATGPMAKVNPFLFSTKYYDWETGLYYYGYRYYNPSTGRWPSRDPLQEYGGLNLYGFALNDGVNKCDSNGKELIEGLVGLGFDLGVQIAFNVTTGKDWYDIDVTGAAVAFGWGLIGAPDVADLKRLNQLRGAISDAADVNAKMVLKASRLPLKSSAKQVAKLDAKLAEMSAKRADALASAAKAGAIIGLGQAVEETVSDIAKEASSGVTQMTGCPNPGYYMGGTANVVVSITVTFPSATTPPFTPIFPIRPEQPFPPIQTGPPQ
jgi:RHS repeat-associated protein